VFSFPDSSDGSVRALVALQYRPPALAPVFAAALAPGDCCYDVGANLGLYALWASRLVGAAGEVHAFEPVQATVTRLRSFIAANAAGNVVVVPAAVGARCGTVSLATVAGASGLAHVIDEAAGRRCGPAHAAGQTDLFSTVLPQTAHQVVTAPVTTLDAYLDGGRAPALVKIDVEGHEAAVLNGARHLLREHRPAVVLEWLPGHQRRAGCRDHDLRTELTAAGYRLHDLTPHGLRHPAGARPTTNVLALDPDHDRHRDIALALRRTRFRRNQTG